MPNPDFDAALRALAADGTALVQQFDPSTDTTREFEGPTRSGLRALSLLSAACPTGVMSSRPSTMTPARRRTPHHGWPVTRRRA